MEIYLMEYDNNGNIKGFYPKSHINNYPNPPTQFIEIDEEKHRFYMNNNGKYKLNIATLENELLPIPEPLPHVKSAVEILKETVDVLVMASLGGF